MNCESGRWRDSRARLVILKYSEGPLVICERSFGVPQDDIGAIYGLLEALKHPATNHLTAVAFAPPSRTISRNPKENQSMSSKTLLIATTVFSALALGLTMLPALRAADAPAGKP